MKFGGGEVGAVEVGWECRKPGASGAGVGGLTNERGSLGILEGRKGGGGGSGAGGSALGALEVQIVAVG